MIQNVDILDLKDPEKGSIGSWVKNDILSVVKKFKNKIRISATVGDIFSNECLIKKLGEFDDLALDYIKFGYFSNNITALKELLRKIKLRRFKTQLVFVIFVDEPKVLKFVEKNLDLLEENKLNFLLLDTYMKNESNLTTFCQIEYLELFIKKCSERNIKVGLAGRLCLEHMIKIKPLNPHVIGFRSAICKDTNRNIICEKKLTYLVKNF